jgi:hypothetical protein
MSLNGNLKHYLMIEKDYIFILPPIRTVPAWWVMALSPYELSIRKACVPAVGTLIG